MLPHFPDEVVETWLFEHNGQIDEFCEWPLESLRWSMIEIKTNELPFKDNGRDYQVSKNLEQLGDTRYQHDMKKHDWPMERIRAFIEQNGTWPRPILLFNNSDTSIKTYQGYPCGTPYHLMEGHKRLATLFYYMSKYELLENHKVWLSEVNGA